ncbi:protein arginine N-methyltransferase 2-like [Antedon mediterranea]|uniref:protein arginine N-methyltransferase 2-like n=1 Tax=Antedon mediterranea TaxID=105859 RepID=UPI003AF44B7A
MSEHSQGDGEIPSPSGSDEQTTWTGLEGEEDCNSNSSSSTSNIENLDEECALEKYSAKFETENSSEEINDTNLNLDLVEQMDRCITLENETEQDSDEIVEVVTALTDFKTNSEHQLQLAKGDKIKVLNKTNPDWWWAELKGQVGYVPVRYINCSSSVGIERLRWQDDEYFNSYANLKLHHEMLQDSVRTKAYQTVIENNANWIKGKVVLDIGCGTGILSMFCAKQGGASKVYGVEASNIASYANDLVQRNNLEDRITIIQGKVEEIELPEQVDIIVSEWMGTLLIFELMIESVIVARNRWLASHGVMWPSIAKLFLVPCKANTEYSSKIDFWRTVYGFDFTPLIPVAKDRFFGRPIFNHLIDADDMLSNMAVILEFDMKEVKVSELEKSKCEFRFVVKKSGTFHGFGSWFAVDFCSQDDENAEDVVLDTGPDKPTTHWKQDMFVMDDPCKVQEGDIIEGAVTITRNPDWRRHLRVTFSFTIQYKISGFQQVFEKLFLLWR